jgi:hypothetical protein
MPTKKRKEREKQKKERDQEWDEILANAPDHVKAKIIADKALKRITGKTETSGLSKSLHTKGQHDAAWAKHDEFGNPLKREDPEELGANLDRKEDKEYRAIEMRERHRAIWGKRGAAKQIAYAEECSVETIRRHMKEFPL